MAMCELVRELGISKPDPMVNQIEGSTIIPRTQTRLH